LGAVIAVLADFGFVDATWNAAAALAQQQELWSMQWSTPR
jgi:hypothetical protein